MRSKRVQFAQDRWKGLDKWQHAGRGMLIYSLIHICFPAVSNWVPFVFAVGFAVGYEIYDGIRGVGFSWRDAVCDTIGAAFVFGLWVWRIG